MEIAFALAKMQEIALDRKAAQKSLGDDLAEALLSLVADMRNAVFLGELIDPPAMVQPEPLKLPYSLPPDCFLEVQPVGTRGVDATVWASAHRVNSNSKSSDHWRTMLKTSGAGRR